MHVQAINSKCMLSLQLACLLSLPLQMQVVRAAELADNSPNPHSAQESESQIKALTVTEIVAPPSKAERKAAKTPAKWTVSSSTGFSFNGKNHGPGIVHGVNKNPLQMYQMKDRNIAARLGLDSKYVEGLSESGKTLAVTSNWKLIISDVDISTLNEHVQVTLLRMNDREFILSDKGLTEGGETVLLKREFQGRDTNCE